LFSECDAETPDAEAGKRHLARIAEIAARGRLAHASATAVGTPPSERRYEHQEAHDHPPSKIATMTVNPRRSVQGSIMHTAFAIVFLEIDPAQSGAAR
jgi:hypothetical protein